MSASDFREIFSIFSRRQDGKDSAIRDAIDFAYNHIENPDDYFAGDNEDQHEYIALLLLAIIPIKDLSKRDLLLNLVKENRKNIGHLIALNRADVNELAEVMKFIALMLEEGRFNAENIQRGFEALQSKSMEFSDLLREVQSLRRVEQNEGLFKMADRLRKVLAETHAILDESGWADDTINEDTQRDPEGAIKTPKQDVSGFIDTKSGEKVEGLVKAARTVITLPERIQRIVDHLNKLVDVDDIEFDDDRSFWDDLEHHIIQLRQELEECIAGEDTLFETNKNWETKYKELLANYDETRTQKTLMDKATERQIETQAQHIAALKSENLLRGNIQKNAEERIAELEAENERLQVTSHLRDTRNTGRSLQKYEALLRQTRKEAEERIAELEAETTQLKTDNSRLQEYVLPEYTATAEERRLQIEGLIAEIAQSNANYMELQGQNAQLRIQLETRDTECETAKARLEILEPASHKLRQELQRYEEDLRQVGDITQLQQQLQNIEDNFNATNAELSRIKDELGLDPLSDIDDISRQIASTQQKNEALYRSENQLTREIINQNDRIREVLGIEQVETDRLAIDVLNESYDFLVEKIEGLEKRNRILEGGIRQYEKDRKTVEANFSANFNELTESSSRNRQLSMEIDRLMEENTRLQQMLMAQNLALDRSVSQLSVGQDDPDELLLFPKLDKVILSPEAQAASPNDEEQTSLYIHTDTPRPEQAVDPQDVNASLTFSEPRSNPDDTTIDLQDLNASPNLDATVVGPQLFDPQDVPTPLTFSEPRSNQDDTTIDLQDLNASPNLDATVVDPQLFEAQDVNASLTFSEPRSNQDDTTIATTPSSASESSVASPESSVQTRVLRSNDAKRTLRRRNKQAASSSAIASDTSPPKERQAFEDRNGVSLNVGDEVRKIKGRLQNKSFTISEFSYGGFEAKLRDNEADRTTRPISLDEVELVKAAVPELKTPRRQSERIAQQTPSEGTTSQKSQRSTSTTRKTPGKSKRVAGSSDLQKDQTIYDHDNNEIIENNYVVILGGIYSKPNVRWRIESFSESGKSAILVNSLNEKTGYIKVSNLRKMEKPSQGKYTSQGIVHF